MLYDPNKLLILAGPCSLESIVTSRTVAIRLHEIQEEFDDLKIVFKGSFNKANRTSVHSNRGPGLEAGLNILQQIKDEFGFLTVTDVHLPEQCEAVGKICDIIQIPAFLCRQTDLLVAASATGKAVNVKKGQFMSPFEMEFVVQKLQESGAKEIMLTDRGTTFGYQNLVVDVRSYPIMGSLGYPTICDATHAVQLPGAGGGKTSGQREFVPVIAKAALAAGANGLFIETHPNPAEAISDAGSQIPLSEIKNLLSSCLKIWKAAKS